MDFKIMLDPESVENKAGLKHPNDDTRLPLIAKKKSLPVSNLDKFMGLLSALLCTIAVNIYQS